MAYAFPCAPHEGIVIADGGMGTELQLAGLDPGACGEIWNLDHPDRVLDIHARYVDSGAQVLLTNTFGANRFGLGRHEIEDRVEEINRAGACIARRAVGEHACVLGDIGPFGGFLAPVGDADVEQVYLAFREQAAALVNAGVDGILIETMSALDEMQLAVRAARGAGAGVVIASVAFDSTRAGLRTMTGATPENAVAAMIASGVDAIGVNCGTGLTMSDYAEIVRRYRWIASSLPIWVKPNAGRPHVTDDVTHYGLGADAFARETPLLVDAGATIIGGCCGTTPGHIRALSSLLGKGATLEH